MTVFVVVPFNEQTAQALVAKIPLKYPKHYVLPRGGFLVASEGTSKEVALSLGIDGTPNNSVGLVTSASGYWGAASNDLWEWIKQNWSAGL